MNEPLLKGDCDILPNKPMDPRPGLRIELQFSSEGRLPDVRHRHTDSSLNERKPGAAGVEYVPHDRRQPK